MKKTTLLHLRILFSFFLLPVFLLACTITGYQNFENLLLCFGILHFLIYPASNGYNSYFDKDKGSIGGLRYPQKVTKELYYVSLALDLLGIVLGLFISVEFVIMIGIYGLVSKVYSHPLIRLKKKPIAGWLAAGIFQGYFTFLLSAIAIKDVGWVETFTYRIQIPGILSTLLLLGSYPMTQVYQHKEDAERGDLTISRLLGILGTFHFTSIVFSISIVGFFYYFMKSYELEVAILFVVSLVPVLIYFTDWYLRVRKDLENANFTSAMRLNFISSLMLNIFFLCLWLG